ncbi:MAG: methylenetetrahydrofolate--tRNA-(uracil(54)-C(5))-methyltransferase (FADH(2)-oxidizing) TrmFO, partial [Christensenellaceae bacterium]|nr:methylenetetrahydrofolate--tRNA-(uracil(54)-C(5))-methyltransferase (FADH(2)-oxidizing) TrmFO [Christensenellaceae bacterium]
MLINIIGGGLAGCEAAYYLLKKGYAVTLYEMRPNKMTPAHTGGRLAELVCSNSLKSNIFETAQGTLKAEMRLLDSIVIKCAEKSAVPAGSALSVNREEFSKLIEETLAAFPNFTLVREECSEITPNTIICTGPLTSDKMSAELARLTGEKLHFYDAVAPIIRIDSVDFSSAFYASRYGKGEDTDYINCPLTKTEYKIFYDALVSAERVVLKEFEKNEIFEGCMPVEVMAKRGEDAIRFGPMRPVGLTNADGERFYAVLQLRREDTQNGLCNLVGFQTNLTFKEQKRVFGLIPALSNAEYVRYGVMHRNTFINAPEVLKPSFEFKAAAGVYLAGQLTGVEGYMESAATGLLAAINLHAKAES